MDNQQPVQGPDELPPEAQDQPPHSTSSSTSQTSSNPSPSSSNPSSQVSLTDGHGPGPSGNNVIVTPAATNPKPPKRIRFSMPGSIPLERYQAGYQYQNGGTNDLLKDDDPFQLKSRVQGPVLPSSTTADLEPEKFIFPEPKDCPRYEIQAKPPLPPGWDNSWNETFISAPRHPFLRIQLGGNSKEYGVLAAMVEPCNISIVAIEKVINRVLWQKFLAQRKELLALKSRNLNLLSELGVSKDELAALALSNINFRESSAVSNLEYSDNIVLLFHCTKADVNEILEEGLDERLARSGSLGRGLYFTDDPTKAISYDASRQTLLVFAVMLGDCLAAVPYTSFSHITREPVKGIEQRRNFRDKFFDSVVSRPNTSNEFVIYNRYKCVPVYVITYTSLGMRSGLKGCNPWGENTNSPFDIARTQFPPFAWINQNEPTVPSLSNQGYPFFAQTLFKMMTPSTLEILNNKNDHSMGSLSEAFEIMDQEEVEVKTTEEDKNYIASYLAKLAELGFVDEIRNIELLQKHKYDPDLTYIVSDLLAEEPRPSTSSSGITHASTSTTGISSSSSGIAQASSSKTAYGNQGLAMFTGSTLENSKSIPVCSMETDTQAFVFAQENEDCLICTNEYPKNHTHWWANLLCCNKKLCTACFQSLSMSGTTMQGVTHSSFKCPFCQTSSGIQIGSCPDGERRVCLSYDNGPLDSWIEIQYLINSGQYNLDRKAYLPNTDEGQNVLRLLGIAFDRRLIFSIGTSATTGRTNTLVWNIHHKTSKTGGPSNYGYPDPTYLLRVLQELKNFGIE